MTNSEKLLSSFSENYFYKELVYADLEFTPIGGTEIELADMRNMFKNMRSSLKEEVGSIKKDFL